MGDRFANGGRSSAVKFFWRICPIINNIISAVISAFIIAGLLAIWNDYFYKADQLAGFWRAEFEIQQSDIARFEGMKTSYAFILQQEGQVLRGATEKISEEVDGEIKNYQPYDRIHGNASGTITYRVYPNSTLDLVVQENGRLRKSTTILHLELVSQNRLEGTFASTAANSVGRVVLKRAEPN